MKTNTRIGLWAHPACFAMAAVFCLSAPRASAADYITSFKNSNTGRCLHSSAVGSIFTWPCDAANTYQDWVVTPSADGLVRLMNRRTGLCLTIPSPANVPTSVACDGSIGQKWFLIAHPGSTYALMRMASYRCINNVSSSTTGSTDTQNCGLQAYDLWKLVP